MMPPIKVDRVTDHQPVHPAGKIRPVRLSNEMKVISHQDKCQHRDLITCPRALQQFRELSLISLIAEDLLPLIAARTKMIKRILKFDPQWPRHPQISDVGREISNI